MKKRVLFFFVSLVLLSIAVQAAEIGVEDFVVHYGSGQITNLSTFDLAIIESNNYNSSDITLIEQNGTKSICYVSVGEDPTLQTGDGEGPGGYASWYLDKDGDDEPDRNGVWGSYYTNASNQGWQDYILDNITYNIDNKGCDGFFLDTVDTVDVYTDTKSGMIDLIGDVDTNYSSSDIIINRGFSIISNVSQYIDGDLFESFTSRHIGSGNYEFWNGSDFQWTTARANDLQTENLTNPFTIFALDYSRPNNTDMIQEDYDRAYMFDFKYYVSETALDKIYLHSVSPGCTVTGEDSSLSKNSDFSTADTEFYSDETIYYRIWSNQIDTKELNNLSYVLKKDGSVVESGDFTDNSDCTFSGSYELSSGDESASWSVELLLKDNNNDEHSKTYSFSVEEREGYTLLGTDPEGDVNDSSIDLLTKYVKYDEDKKEAYYKMVINGPYTSGRYYEIFIDNDESNSTGYSVQGIGAEYMVENGNLYKHGGGGWNWTLVKAITDNINGSQREYIVKLSDIGEIQGSASDLAYVASKTGLTDYSGAHNFNYDGSSLLGSDPGGDVSDTAIDLLALFANSSLDHVSYTMTINGSYTSGRFYQTFIDNDENSSTGYSVQGIGADYLIENGHLYQHAGGGWSWTWKKWISYLESGSNRTYTVSFSDVGESAGSASDLVFAGSKTGSTDYSAAYNFVN